MLLVQQADRIQHLEFSVQVEAVAGLDLGRGGAVGEHGVQAGQGLLDQLVQRGGAGGAHGGHDAAASLHDLHVRGAGDALLELAGPVACPQQMGVGIDEAGQHDLAGRVDDVGGVGVVQQGQHVGRPAHGHDLPGQAGQRAILDQARIGQIRPALRPCRAGASQQSEQH